MPAHPPNTFLHTCTKTLQCIIYAGHQSGLAEHTPFWLHEKTRPRQIPYHTNTLNLTNTTGKSISHTLWHTNSKGLKGIVHPKIFLLKNTKEDILKNCLCLYNESQSDPKQLWSPLTFIIWTNTLNYLLLCFTEKRSHTDFHFTRVSDGLESCGLCVDFFFFYQLSGL